MRSRGILVLLMTPFALIAQPAWDDHLDFQDCILRLNTEQIKKNTGFGTFLAERGKQAAKASNKMRLIELESGLQGIFKPGGYCYGEVAAYKASNALGLRLVPPTVIRTIDGKVGSLQFYIDLPHNVSNNEAHYFERLHPKIISDMKVFYFVFGQWDIHVGNQLISASKGKLFLGLIDNAGMLHRQYVLYGHRPFIERGEEHEGLPCVDSQTFPFNHVKVIKSGDNHKVRSLFGKVIPQQLNRLMDDPHDIHYLFWKNSLWIEVKHSIGIIEKFYASTIHALKSLTTETLREIWAEWYAIDSCHAEQLIALTLERRDALVKIAESAGTIVKRG